MEKEIVSRFGATDYSVFGGMLLISGAIGLYTSFIGSKSPEEFLMGNRSFSPLPVAISLLTSYVSSISLLGFSGEAYAYGTQMSLFLIGVIFAILFAAYVVLPILYPLKLTSTAEYIEVRFKSKRLRDCISFMTVLQSVIYMGVCLYAPTIALVTVLNFSYLTYIFLLGTITTIYSSFGGIRAVIWTDVFQLIVMLIGLVAVDLIGISQNGGLIKTWSIASEGGRMDNLNFNPSPFERHNFFNILAFGFFFYAYWYSAAQINVQRMCAVRSLRDAKSVLLFNIFGMILIYFLIFTAGLVAYVAYKGCDPTALGLIEGQEEILTHFIIDRMGYIPGLPGMFVATLIGGTMSSLSSVINAIVAMVWRDVCLKFQMFSNASIRCATITNKVMSLIIGALLIGMAILFAQADGLVELCVTITGTLMGPVFGVYLLGYLFPKCNLKGVWTGFILSSLFANWISIGAALYKPAPTKLPFSAENCEDFGVILNNSSVAVTQILNETFIEVHDETDSFLLKPLYEISYTLYCVIGPMLCIIIAHLVSFATGNENLSEISPKYVSPSVHKFYWSESELETYHRTENKLQALEDGKLDYELIVPPADEPMNNLY